MSSVSTHVLDTARGAPAEGIRVTLEHQSGNGWTLLGDMATNGDGRIGRFIPPDQTMEAGVYRLRFQTGEYQKGFYPEIIVTFLIDDQEQHYHVPLLLSPYGYSTYRGS